MVPEPNGAAESAGQEQTEVGRTAAGLVRDGRLAREAAAEELRRCLGTLVRAARLDVSFRVELPEAAGAGAVEAPEVVVDFDGRDRDLLLERGAELLQALEYIAVRWIRLDPKFHDRVRFDCANYRADRLAELKLSAQVAADRVRETRMPFRFNPMGARERRIIHLALQDQRGIRTASEGTGDRRQVVVFPADRK
jgi:spoIIIJ-associated protein